VLRIGADERRDPSHYAFSLIQQILDAFSLIQQILGHSDQKIGTRIFAQHYCLEEGQSVEQFRANLGASMLPRAGSGLT
jgi:hypothetical protein